MDTLENLFESITGAIGIGLVDLVVAILILVIGYIVAKLIERAIAALLRRSDVDNRLARAMGSDPAQEPSVEKATARLIFYILMLFVLMAFFQRLNLTIVTEPLNRLLSQIAAFIPNLVGAAIVLFVGYVLARILRGLVTQIAAGLGTERLAQRVGLTLSLSRLIGTLVYALILIPAIIAALNVLDIEAISGPATLMLQTFLDAIPNIFGAALLLIITYFVARIIADIVADLLRGFGFNQLVAGLGFSNLTAPDTTRAPSDIVGIVAMVAIMIFAAMEAADLLGFEILAALIAEFLVFGGRLLLAIIILGLGFYLANLARDLILESGTQNASLMATIARWSILVFTGAVALKELGVADAIINLAFGLTLGAIAVAAALAFGLGGRQIAARELEQTLQEVRSQPPTPPPPAEPPGQPTDTEPLS